MTISPSGVLLAVPPRVCSSPLSVSSAGQEAAELAASAGLTLDPWQRLALDVILGERADGRWTCFECGLLVARQNGKGAILEARELAGLFLFGDRLILHSAHEFKTAAEAFLRVKALIDNTDDLRKRVARIRTSHGDEGIELLNGARLRFVARSRSSGRGFSGDTVILDEAQELPKSAMGALLPTLSARPNPQVIYTGTVPAPENDSEHFTSVRDRGRAGGDPALGWIEWSPDQPEDEPANLDDRGAWTAANPALGIRITEETIERERNALGDEEFARERLSIWGGAKTNQVIPAAKWAAVADRHSRVVDPVCFAVDVTPDRGFTSIGLAGRRDDGQQHVEVIDNRRGTGWVAERCRDLKQRWSPLGFVLDPAGPAGSLIVPLRDVGIEPTVVSAKEMAQACGAFYDAVADDQTTLRHVNQPILNTALGAARKRPLGDAWAWHRKDSNADISPLVAVTLAKFGFDTLAPTAQEQFAPRRIR